MRNKSVHHNQRVSPDGKIHKIQFPGLFQQPPTTALPPPLHHPALLPHKIHRKVQILDPRNPIPTLHPPYLQAHLERPPILHRHAGQIPSVGRIPPNCLGQQKFCLGKFGNFYRQIEGRKFWDLGGWKGEDKGIRGPDFGDSEAE